MRSRRRTSGVSAVVGTAVAVMIFFTIMIPMWLYLQQLQTLFMDEVSRRLQFEVEKLNEELEVTLTLQPPDSLNRRFIYLVMMNKGPIEITVPALYIESNRRGLFPKTDEQFRLPPGAIVMRRLNYVVDPGEEVMVRAPTLRGNSFVSGDPIGPKRLPYLLIVQLSNVSLGYRYEVMVSVLSVDIDTTRGCVSLKGEEFSDGCKESVKTDRFVTRVEDLSDVFAFNIAPGVYEVRVAQCSLASGSCAGVTPTPVRVVANSHVVVQIDVRTRLNVPRPIPLQISPLQQNQMMLLSENDQEANITIPYILTLGNITEPLRNVRVVFTVIQSENLTSPSVGFTAIQTINLLSPGSSHIGFFSVGVSEETGASKEDFGGFIIYRLRVEGATGAITRDSYGAADFSLSDVDGVVYVCRWWIEGVNVRTSCRAPGSAPGP